MAQNESEIRYLTPPTVEVKKKKYCRFKKNRIKYIDYKDIKLLQRFIQLRKLLRRQSAERGRDAGRIRCKSGRTRRQ